MSTRETMTDAEALELHVRHITAAGQRPASIRARHGAIRRLTEWFDSDNPRAVIEATGDQLADWQASQAHLAAASMRKYVDHTQMYYRWLVRPMRIIDESPAEELRRPVVRRRLPRPISEDDLLYALHACSDDRLRTWLILGAYAGLRSIDIVGLNHDDLLTDQAVPWLRVRGKGDNEYRVVVGQRVVEALAPFRTRRGALFVDDAGERFKPPFVMRQVNAYLRMIGVPCTFHQFRHRYGTRMYEISRDIRFTQQQMRHASVSSTELYVAVPTDQAVTSVGVLDEELSTLRRRDDGGGRGHLRSVGGN